MYISIYIYRYRYMYVSTCVDPHHCSSIVMTPFGELCLCVTGVDIQLQIVLSWKDADFKSILSFD